MSLHFSMRLRVNENISTRNCQQEHLILFKKFKERFSRCSPLLHFLAGRILGRHEEVEEAVRSCRITASHNLPRFEYEGAFRSWLVRILIDEALAIRQRHSAVTTSEQV
jgi:DNA-directed RNA polymerase specialized sigma24 family protein